MAPLMQHMQRRDEETRLVRLHHVAEINRRRATTRNVAERLKVFDRVNLQTQWNRGVGSKGHDLFLRQTKALQLLLNQNNEVSSRCLIDEIISDRDGRDDH